VSTKALQNWIAVCQNHLVAINAGRWHRHPTREPHLSDPWATGLRLLLQLTAVISIQFVSVAYAANVEVSPPADSAGEIKLSPCSLEGVPQLARCGSLDVAENPDHPDVRRLRIAVAVIPATGGKSLPDPIVILMGGPGEDAISAAEIYFKQFTTLRQDRDILLVDQRGTGRSGALNCPLFSAQEPAVNLRDVFPPAAVERCEQNLRVRADLTQYTYDRFANDLEHPTGSRLRTTESVRRLIRNSSRADLPANVPQERAHCVYGQCCSDQCSDATAFRKDRTNCA
jgi:hypothetical protein